MAHGMMADEMH